MGPVQLITGCRGCGVRAIDLPTVFSMDSMPLAGAFAPTREQALSSPRYPLTWVQCPNCGLVQVDEDVPDEMLFGEYCYASSSVPALVRHFERLANQFKRRWAGDRVRFLEIGCNDGVLLRQLPVEWDLVGVDPSDVARRADGAYDLYNEPFTREIGLEGFDIVSASNCLAHSSSMREIVLAAHAALVDGGEFVVEVHDLESTLSSGQWDTIYHEHKAEFSAGSLAAVVCPVGFELASLARLPLHGGLLRARFMKVEPSEPMAPAPANFDRLRRAYDGRRETETYRVLADTAKPLAYGAAGRATVWFNQLPELQFQYVADDSPLRAGRFVPGTGLPIERWRRSYEAEVCVVTAWSYFDEIVAAHPEFRGRWLRSFDEVAEVVA